MTEFDLIDMDILPDVEEVLAALSPLTTADAVAQLKAAVQSCIRKNLDRDEHDWFPVTDDSFSALARRDGQVTVIANSGGFWVTRDDKPELMESAEAAVEAAIEVPAATR